MNSLGGGLHSLDAFQFCHVSGVWSMNVHSLVETYYYVLNTQCAARRNIQTMNTYKKQ